ncbi:MAG: ribonuclease III [Epsilonproteobacteria bacterium]|nr:MAG: ribonuclease III [Campylobacterota bacterium]RLA67267.1 MAG: ribonuclease III [Campylobacterota bacterium]
MKETTSKGPIYVPKLSLSSIDDVLRYILESSHLNTLITAFNYQFNDPKLFLNALTHTSAVHEFAGIDLKSNEKLEFLGDAVLDTLVTSIIWRKYPELSEGDLSKLRGALVNKNSLANLSRLLNLGQCLILGKGEIHSRGFEKDGILADAFEALIGAIFLDSGFSQTQQAFQSLLDFYEKKTGEEFIHIDKLHGFDSKSQLQELTMQLFKEFPIYKASKEENELFKIEIFLKEISLAQIVSKSKKEGEHKLAEKVLKEKLWESKLC